MSEEVCRSAFGAGDDCREYNVYVETAAVEAVWPPVDGWPAGAQVGPLAVSVEIALKILADSLEEVGGRAYVNDASKAEAVSRCVCSLLGVLGDLGATAGGLPAGLEGSVSQQSAWGDVMGLLGRVANGPHLRSGLVGQYAVAVGALGFDLGLVADGSLPVLDWDGWVQPRRAHSLYSPDRRDSYVEDPIFVRVHQVCEGVLEAMLVELDKVEAALYVADYQAAEGHVLMAARFADPFTHAMGLLGEMSQLDYAPLRTALRDASGAQSARGQARRQVVRDHFWLFDQQLRHRGLDSFTVFADPAAHVDEYRLLSAFKVLGRSVNNTMSTHAHMVYNVLGSAVNGTLGARVLSLGQVAAYPLLRDITNALDNLTLWTSLRYAHHSGIVIFDQERTHSNTDKYDIDLPDTACDRQLMNTAIGAYFEAIGDHDKERWKQLFADRFRFEDPKGTKPYVTEANLDVFFRNFRQLFPEVNSTAHEVTATDHRSATVRWAIEADTFLGAGITAAFAGTETFYFDTAGKIVAAFADWDPAALAEDLMDQYRAQLTAARAA
ncbi:nuclear transport factor 2 family protein [Candidatus Poriferisodalis sp.]|uniref:nuclear transport factor 2 family protein n=1 Tax=Candidatus Poriferisodalis sp. TaxID=3101277 RepID=UPI003B5CD2FD